MKFTQTSIEGAWLIEIEPHADARGLFARTVCSSEFASVGLEADFVQQSVSWNPRSGTLRGLHYQAAPHEEVKLVRATRGAIFDVIVDLRQGSLTYGQHVQFELSADNRRQLYIPKGVAHGFQTLVDETEVLYAMTVPFHPDAPRGIRWNDPVLAIDWARAIDTEDRAQLSDADSKLPFWADVRP